MYVLKEKFKLPQSSTAPTYSLLISWFIGIAVAFGILAFFAGVLTEAISLVIFSAQLFAGALLTSWLRKLHHQSHLKHYYGALENKWLLTDDFLELQHFLMLIGFGPKLSAELATNFGVAGLAGDGYQISRGYYIFKNHLGEPVVTAVELGSERATEDTLKVTAKLLQMELE